MAGRLIDMEPRRRLSLTRQEFLDGIRTSEGRGVCAYICPRSANYVEKVSNIELVSSFGADLINMEAFDPYRPQMCGLPSRDSGEDTVFKEHLQLEMGYGWTIRELRELTGRPIGLILKVKEYEDQTFSGIGRNTVLSEQMLDHVLEEGYDYVTLCGFEKSRMLDALKMAKEIIDDRIALAVTIPHGPGKSGEKPIYNLREIITPDYAYELTMAGADIVDVPAVGVTPGFTPDYVSDLIDSIHRGGALAAVSIAHSLEGSDEDTVRRIAVSNKVCGADMYNFSAGGVFESVALPEALMAFCIAVKGRRFTYRAMCQSPLR